MKYGFLLLLMLIIACREDSNSRGYSLYSQGVKHLNRFYETRDSSELLLAKKNVEKADRIDPQGRNSRFACRLSILSLLKKYKDGIVLVSSVDSSMFVLPYQKNLYLKTFRALQAKVEQDTLNERKYLEEIIVEIELYMKNNTISLETLSDLYYTKLRLVGKNKVIAELESKSALHDECANYYNTLMTTISCIDTLDL